MRCNLRPRYWPPQHLFNKGIEPAYVSPYTTKSGTSAPWQTGGSGKFFTLQERSHPPKSKINKEASHRVTLTPAERCPSPVAPHSAASKSLWAPCQNLPAWSPPLSEKNVCVYVVLFFLSFFFFFYKCSFYFLLRSVSANIYFSFSLLTTMFCFLTMVDSRILFIYLACFSLSFSF